MEAAAGRQQIGSILGPDGPGPITDQTLHTDSMRRAGAAAGWTLSSFSQRYYKQGQDRMYDEPMSENTIFGTTY